MRRSVNEWFGNYSSATPLVTASALLVQQRAKVALGGVMLPRELRSYLAATGTPQAPDPRTIGPLPNMFAAITRINEADVGITAQVGGSLATASVTNHGPSRARDLVVDVDIFSNSVVGLTRVDNTQAVCVGRAPPPGAQCAGQCSYIRCTYPALMAGPGPLTWACSGSYGTPSLTLSASVVSGSHTDPVSANNAATQSAALSCGGVGL